MAEKTINTMNEAEFEALVERFIEHGPAPVTAKTFFEVMADVAEEHKQREVELSGRVVNGEVIFDNPAPFPLAKNTFYVGDTKITLNLRVEGEAA